MMSEDCAHRAGFRDDSAHCTEQVLRVLRAGRVHSLHRVPGTALYPRLARQAGSGSAHRAGGLDCVGVGVVDHQEPSVEGCAAGEDGIVDSGIADRYRRCAFMPVQDVSL